MRMWFPVALATAGLSFSAPADASTGDPGFELQCPPTVAIGESFALTAKAPVGSSVVLLFSLDDGPTPTKYGDLCLGAIVGAVPFPQVAETVDLPCFVPCTKTAIGLTAYFQFLALTPSGDVGVSSGCSITLVDGDCGDCCKDGKPKTLTLRYTGAGCEATSHSQDPGKVTCAGDPMHASPVRILSIDKPNPDDPKAKVWFDGEVAFNEPFDISAAAAGQDTLKSNTFCFIYDLQGNLLQTVGFHTSCSQPLFEGDQFGSIQIIDCDTGASSGPDSCEDGKPAALTMRYTGESCDATSHSQDSSKVSCSGDPAFATPVRILAVDKENPDDPKAKVWFDGEVALDGTFEISAASAGASTLKAETHVFLYGASGELLQHVEFHTSCSQPLVVGDQFGSLVLEVFTPQT